MAGKLLTKGGNVALPAGVAEVNVGLSWEAPGAGFDLDAWTLALGADGRVLSDDYFVFFNNMKSPCGSIHVSADNQEGGSAEEDDEVVTVRLAAVPPGVHRIVFIVNIYEARRRRQCFGDLDNAAIRLFDPVAGEFARYNLGRGDTSTEASLVFGELYRHGGGWKFRAIAQGNDRGPAALVREYGVEVDDDPEADLAAPPQEPAAAAEPVSLAKGKIELTEPGARINMTKTPSMESSVYWTKPNKDLGLILHVAYTDGTREYYDWRNLKDRTGAVKHHGDRKKGGRDVREYATIRFDKDPRIATLAVIAYSEVSNGIGSFKSMGARRGRRRRGHVVTVDLNKGGTFSYHTVLAVATVNQDGTITLERSSRFSASGREERPEVDARGLVSMNTGPVVFKPRC